MNNKHTGLLIATCVLSTLSLLLIFSLVLVSWMYENKITYKDTVIYSLQAEINQLNAEKTQLSIYNSDETYETESLVDKIAITRASIPITEQKNIVEYYRSLSGFYDRNACIVTPSGEKYHRLSCSHIRDSEQYKILNISAAELYGYKKCSDCY